MKTKNFTVSESIILSSFYLTCSDGDIDDKEVNLIKNDTFFGKHYSKENESLFVDLFEDEKNDFLKLIEEEFSKSFENTTSQFKEEFIDSLVKLIIADGEVEQNEIFVLNKIGASLGLTESQVLEIMKKNNQKKRERLEQLKKQNSSSNCFVVTATMGDINHQVVQDFRYYRDNTLLETHIGKVVINFYYKVGPYMAKLIENNEYLKHLTFKHLISPIHKKLKKQDKF
jgi:hypothetical protein